MIDLNGFLLESADLRQRELDAVERVLKSGWYILGEEVKAFETAWARACGARFSVGVGNGMDAIEIGLRASGVGPGDEVVTTPMTAFATVLAIIRAGAVPVLADIDPETALMDFDSVRRCVGSRTRAVLLVHLYGQMAEMDKWKKFCEELGLQLFEDCAQAHLAAWHGIGAGNWGSWGAFSFYPTKNLGAIGDGGALNTNDLLIAEKSKTLRNYGQSERYRHPEIGLNSRLDELQAAILRVRLEMLDQFTRRRREIAAAYHQNIGNPLVDLLSRPRNVENHVYHLFVVRCNRRDQLSIFLKERGIQTLIHYPIPIHRQPPCVQFNRDPNGLRKAELHAESCLSIPCHPQMTDAAVAEVIQAINEFH